ncbi:MAG TPA: 4-hydroxy-tetrahydrodipicolinate reductase [Bacillota bacterium]|nr:4-hydroxy-tetrahydrodipicolinate reductase [Bacillota bacterium]
MDKVATSFKKKTKNTHTTSSIRIVVAGPRGKMGSEAIHMINHEHNFILVGCVDHKEVEQTNESVPTYTDVNTCLEETKPDVFIDLTKPEVGYTHTKAALKLGVRPVVGTTGFTSEQLKEITQLAEDKKIGCIIAPNFALGAVLMMKFSQMAAKFYENVEIIEKHHNQKIDAPSGTALKTSELIREARKTSGQKSGVEESESIPGVRGGYHDGIHIHSMRLPGLVAHQEVVFGGQGETLTIKHDSIDRASFMEGIKLCVDQVMNLETCIYGMENIIDFKEY